ncbi:MAG TPA: hypothetical protein VFU86_00305 [Terriglobales bacterium]|nr:hypothetical protein [Terriglobales bacterium]
MSEQDEREIREALRRSFPPADTALRRDLWPDVLRKVDTESHGVPWYDWALIAVMAALCLYAPRLILVLAYHL